MMFALGVAILVVATGATMASPFAGMLIYWVWVVVRPGEILPGLGGGLPMERIIALTLLASLLLRGKLRPLGEMDQGRAALALLIFLGVNYASVVTAVDRGYAFGFANDFGKVIIFFFCIIALIDDETQLRKALWVYAWAIGWTAASSLWNYEAHPYYRQGIQRATALTETGGDPNALAATLTLSLPILLVLMKAESGRKRLLLIGIMATAVLCTIITGSRIGFILLLLIVVVTAARSAKGAILVPVLTLFLVVGWTAMPAQYQERYKTILPFLADPLHEGKSSEEESAHGRVIGFAVAWQMFTDRPILGVGVGNFPLAWRRPDTPYNYHGYKGWHNPHNLVGKLIGELGLLGVFSFGAYIMAVWRELREAKRTAREADQPMPFLSGLASALSLILVALFVDGLTGHNLYRVDWYVAGALAIVVCRLATQSAPAEMADEFNVPETEVGAAGSLLLEAPGRWGQR